MSKSVKENEHYLWLIAKSFDLIFEMLVKTLQIFKFGNHNGRVGLKRKECLNAV